LVEVTDDLHVRVELHGACADCQMIHMTMKGGVEQAIRQAAPEVVKVEAINWSE
jgi:Fe-S cluster biogenesis protein NfuA